MLSDPVNLKVMKSCFPYARKKIRFKKSLKTPIFLVNTWLMLSVFLVLMQDHTLFISQIITYDNFLGNKIIRDKFSDQAA